MPLLIHVQLTSILVWVFSPLCNHPALKDLLTLVMAKLLPVSCMKSELIPTMQTTSMIYSEGDSCIISITRSIVHRTICGITLYTPVA
jgi:hypothetical protein